MYEGREEKERGKKRVNDILEARERRPTLDVNSRRERLLRDQA